MEDRRAELVAGFPIETVHSENKGWYLVASRDISPGELILETKSFATAIQDRLKTRVCCKCFTFAASKWTISCSSCREAFYCSKECEERGKEEHQLLECRFFKRIRGPVKGVVLDEEDLTEAKLIIKTVAKMEHLKRSVGGKDRSEDVDLLVSNRDSLPQEMMRCIEGVSKLVWKVVGGFVSRSMPHLDEEGGTEVFDGVGIVDLICKQRCNRFGIWSNKMTCLGMAVCPAASFFNHSCTSLVPLTATGIPNCLHDQRGDLVTVRTLYAVAKGEELNISYCRLFQDTEARVEELKWNYCFTCRCHLDE